MAKKSGKGFRAPKHYDPSRGKKTSAAGAQRKDGRRSDQEQRPHTVPLDAGARATREAAAAPTQRAEKARTVSASSVVHDRLEAQLTSYADAAEATFAELGLGGNIIRVLGEMGAERPFPIQVATIPDVLAGRNVLGRGRTGSGKTIAFGASLVERLLQLKASGAFASDPPAKRTERLKRGERAPRRPAGTARKPKALILAPTRELALQIDRTVQPIARSVGLYTAQVYGGVPQTNQVDALRRGVDIVIGTPGRTEDLIAQGHLDLRQVVVAVLDEADHMCDLGFLEPVQRVLRHIDRHAQHLLFSATLDAGVRDLVDEFLPERVVHEVAGEDQASGTIDHRVVIVPREAKLDALQSLVDRPGKVLVFTRTRVYAEQLCELFTAAGVAAVALHGDLSQVRRTQNLAQLTSGRARVLVATDVAARGIHVDDIDFVLQADAPDDYKTYLHRAGRTGRAGRAGTVATVIPPRRAERMRELLEHAEIVPSFFGEFQERRAPRRS